MENTNYSPIKRFEEQLKSEVKQEDINEVTETIEIKEEPIECKDWQETEDPLHIPSDTFEHKFEIETIESMENDIKIEPNSYESELGKEDSIAAVHDGKSLVLPNKLFKCMICDASFTQKYTVKKHVEAAVHEEIKPCKCKCDTCDARSAQKRVLNLTSVNYSILYHNL